jgi:CDP-paratose 2-epimerase
VGREVWVTETGLATWDIHSAAESRFDEQQRRLVQAFSVPAERVYWYSVIDLAAERPCIEMTEDHRVELDEYHMGLVAQNGNKKSALHTLKEILKREAAADFRTRAVR